MTLAQWLRDTAERAGSTLVEAAIVYVLAAGATGDGLLAGLVTACVIALANVVKAALTTWIPTPTSFWSDVLVRALWTFLIAVCGALASVGWLDLIDLGWWQVALRSAAIAALVVVKSLLARNRPDTVTPASLLVDRGPRRP